MSQKVGLSSTANPKSSWGDIPNACSGMPILTLQKADPSVHDRCGDYLMILLTKGNVCEFFFGRNRFLLKVYTLSVSQIMKTVHTVSNIVKSPDCTVV